MKNKIVFSSRELDRIIEMAWEDRTSFDAIEKQFGVVEKDVIKLISEVGIVPATAAVAQLLMEVLTHQQSEDSEEKKPKKEE